MDVAVDDHVDPGDLPRPEPPLLLVPGHLHVVVRHPEDEGRAPGGLAGIEGSICALRDWKEFGELMGAFYAGHYVGDFAIKVEDPAHPLTACFGNEPLRVFDQAYVPGPPYSRKNVRVLLSLDMTQTADPLADPKMAWLKGSVERLEASTGRKDDYPISWVKTYGRGRVFYCSLGVQKAPYSSPLFLQYLLAGNTGELLLMTICVAIGLPSPLLPIHLLWINLVTDGLPGLALAGEHAERNVMQRPPRPPKESIFAHGMWQHILWVGLLMGGVSLLTQAWAIHSGTAHWQSMVFTVLTLSQLGHVLAIRSERESLFSQGVLSNRMLIGALSLTFVLQMAVLYVPWLNPIFKTEPLSLGELAACLALSSVVFIGVEIEKALVRRGPA